MSIIKRLIEERQKPKKERKLTDRQIKRFLAVDKKVEVEKTPIKA